MAFKTTRQLDEQGRIILPVHIRKTLNLDRDSTMEVAMEDDGTVILRTTTKRCTFCADLVEGKRHLTIAKDKYICTDCAAKVAQALEAKEVTV